VDPNKRYDVHLDVAVMIVGLVFHHKLQTTPISTNGEVAIRLLWLSKKNAKKR
jgi:hypothetical protein